MSDIKHRLNYQFRIISAIRQFFTDKGFIDVMTPPMVESPVIEPHIQTFSIKENDMYLHTSPEFWMKYLLSEGFEKIFNISYCFRNEPESPIHRPQFLMLEWYRTQSHYHQIKDDTIELIKFCADQIDSKINLKVTHKTVQEIFIETINMDILDFLEKEKLKSFIETNYPDIPMPSLELPWDDYYHLLYLNKVEPTLSKYPLLVIDEYPAPLSALSMISPDDPRVCQRFEVYMNGIELANCYQELLDPTEQEQRFHEFNKTRLETYKHQMPYPMVLINSLKKGINGSAGIALGVERLTKALTNCDNPFFE